MRCDILTLFPDMVAPVLGQKLACVLFGTTGDHAGTHKHQHGPWCCTRTQIGDDAAHIATHIAATTQ